MDLEILAKFLADGVETYDELFNDSPMLFLIVKEKNDDYNSPCFVIQLTVEYNSDKFTNCDTIHECKTVEDWKNQCKIYGIS